MTEQHRRLKEISDELYEISHDGVSEGNHIRADDLLIEAVRVLTDLLIEKASNEKLIFMRKEKTLFDSIITNYNNSDKWYA